ncbi:hypothetical protein ACNS7O_01310 [Haloferacaceae archaeon DSL9]
MGVYGNRGLGGSLVAGMCIGLFMVPVLFVAFLITGPLGILMLSGSMMAAGLVYMFATNTAAQTVGPSGCAECGARDDPVDESCRGCSTPRFEH